MGGEGSTARVLAGGASGMGVGVGGIVAVGGGVAMARTTPVGVGGVGGFKRLGAINKNAPNATRLARIHKMVVKLGKRDARLFKI